jgi:hypothetical protein
MQRARDAIEISGARSNAGPGSCHDRPENGTPALESREENESSTVCKQVAGVAPTHEFDSRPESKSWPASDPLLLFITWAAGGQDEFYRYENQVCSIFKFTDPNTGIVTANATYSAQLRASGKAQSGFTYLVGRNYSWLELTLHDASGGPLMTFQTQQYSIFCNTNYAINQYWPFNAGLYDLVAFPTWGVAGPQSVDRC